MGRRQVPGVLAVTYNEGKLPPVDLQALLADDGVRAVITHRAGLVVASWGLADNRLEADQALLLSGTNWGDTGAVTSDQVARWLADGSLGVLGRLLPPATFMMRYTTRATQLGPHALPAGATVTADHPGPAADARDGSCFGWEER